jgi:hypothetical protein
MKQWRNIKQDGKQTTIALEAFTWEVIDKLSGNQWQDWVYTKLQVRPNGSTKTHWLRNEALHEVSHVM